MDLQMRKSKDKPSLPKPPSTLVGMNFISNNNSCDFTTTATEKFVVPKVISPTPNKKRSLSFSNPSKKDKKDYYSNQNNISNKNSSPLLQYIAKKEEISREKKNRSVQSSKDNLIFTDDRAGKLWKKYPSKNSAETKMHSSLFKPLSEVKGITKNETFFRRDKKGSENVILSSTRKQESTLRNLDSVEMNFTSPSLLGTTMIRDSMRYINGRKQKFNVVKLPISNDDKNFRAIDVFNENLFLPMLIGDDDISDTNLYPEIGNNNVIRNVNKLENYNQCHKFIPLRREDSNSVNMGGEDMEESQETNEESIHKKIVSENVTSIERTPKMNLRRRNMPYRLDLYDTANLFID